MKPCTLLDTAPALRRCRLFLPAEPKGLLLFFVLSSTHRIRYGEQDFTHQAILSVTQQPQTRRPTQMKSLRCGEHIFSADLVPRPFGSVVKPKQARSQVLEKFGVHNWRSRYSTVLPTGTWLQKGLGKKMMEKEMDGEKIEGLILDW